MSKQYLIDERTFYIYLAQLRAMGAHQEANAVQVLAALFTPELVIDEERMGKLVKEHVDRQEAVQLARCTNSAPIWQREE